MMAKNITLFKLAVSFCIFLSCLVQAAPAASDLQIHAARHEPCADENGGVHIIAARGSTEPPGQGALSAVSDLIMAGIPGSTSSGVKYPATLTNYYWSVGRGTASLTKEIEDYVARCPRSRIVVMGYSQGGQVVMNTLCGTNEGDEFSITPRLHSKLWKHIAAVLVYADPSHLAGMSYDMGTSYLNGIFPRTKPHLCDPFAKRIQAYCDYNDPYCASGDDITVHLSYFEIYNTQASEWIISKAKAHLPWLRKGHHD